MRGPTLGRREDAGFHSQVHDPAHLFRRHHIDETLVLAGKPGWNSGALLKTISSLGLEDRIIFLNYVDSKELPYLYSGARLFVYPSIIEGFGFPPLEAMACGTPTVSAKTTALQENLSGAAELVHPENVDALAVSMLRLLTDEVLREDYRKKGFERARGFSWTRAAEKMLGVYGELSDLTQCRSL